MGQLGWVDDAAHRPGPPQGLERGGERRLTLRKWALRCGVPQMCIGMLDAKGILQSVLDWNAEVPWPGLPGLGHAVAAHAYDVDLDPTAWANNTAACAVVELALLQRLLVSDHRHPPQGDGGSVARTQLECQVVPH